MKKSYAAKSFSKVSPSSLQVEKVERKVRILEEELRLLAEDKLRKERQYKEAAARLEEERQKAERQRVIAQGEEDDDR